MARSNDSRDQHNETKIKKIMTERSRRKFLRLGIVSGAVGLAGCNAQSGDSQNDTGSENNSTKSDKNSDDKNNSGSGKLKDKVLTPGSLRNPAEMQFNQLGKRLPGVNQLVAYNPKGATYDGENNIRKITHKNYSIPDKITEGSTASVTIRDDLKWHNGDKVTAQDFADSIYLQMEHYSSYPSIKSVNSSNESTFEVTFSRPTNPEIFEAIAVDFDASAGGPQYDEFVKMYEDAESEDEIKKVKQEISETTFEKPIGHGPFKFVEKTPKYTLYKRFDDYPIADMNFPKIKYIYAGESLQTAFKNDEYDIGASRKLLSENIWPGDYISDRYKPLPRGWSLSFNVTKKPFSNRRVRQALAWVVNRYATNLDSAPSGLSSKSKWANRETPMSITGLGPSQYKDYLGDVNDAFPSYGYAKPNNNSQIDSQREKASSILQNEGFSKKNGKWMKPNGKRFSLTIDSAPAFTDWMKSSQRQLKDFGIDASLRAMEGTKFWSSHTSSQSKPDWDLASLTWGSGITGQQVPHPYTTLSVNLPSKSIDAKGLRTRYGVEKEKWDSPHYIPEIPMPVGETNGSIQEVDYTKIQQNLFKTTDEKKVAELSRKLAWVKNQNVSTIPLYFFPRAQVLTTDDWSWPEENSPFYYSPQLSGPLSLGKVQGKEK